MRPNSYHPISIKPNELKKLEFFDFDKILEAAPGVISAIGSIFGGGKPEDTSDVGFQNFMAQKKAAEAAEARRLAAIKAEEDQQKTIYWIVGGVVVAVLIIGGAVLLIPKK